jgi:hypothetical protein
MGKIASTGGDAKHLSEIRAEVAFTRVHSATCDLTKTFRLDASHKLKADGAPPLTKATAHRTSLKGTASEMALQLGQYLNCVSPRQAFVPAPPPASKDEWRLLTLKEAELDKDAIARSPRYFRAAEGPGLLAIDLDFKTYPAHIRDKLREVGNVSKALASVFPAIDDAACVSRPSTSAGIRIIETGEVSENTGEHRYLLVLDGRDASAFVKRYADHLALAGWIWGEVSEAGIVLYRGLFDVAASSEPSRLFYEADPKLEGQGLERVKGAREPKIKEGGFLDTHALPPLTEEQMAALCDLKKQIANDLEPERKKKRAAWEAKRIDDLVRRGKTPEAARKAVTGAVERHTLSGDFEIKLDSGEYVAVSEILENPEAFHRQTGADPLEPDYHGGRNIAVIISDAPPFRIHSQAHGGIEYRLVKTPEEWFEPAPENNAPEPQAVNASTAGDEWPELVDLFGHDDPAGLSDVPPSACPPVIYRWALSEARRKGAPPMFPIVSAITVAAAAIGNSLRIRPREHDTGWTEPAALWTVPVASPGQRKSPIIKAAKKPLNDVDGEYLRADRARQEEWLARPKPKKGDADNRGPEPRIRRRVVDNPTLEKQVRIHSDNPRGLLIAPDEFAAIPASYGAYKKNGDGDRTLALRMFDGDDIKLDRVGAGTIYADSALLSILAGTQPDKIATLTGGLGADGFLQRILFVVHDGVRRAGIDEPPDERAAKDYEGLIRYLATAEHGRDATVQLKKDGHRILREATDNIDALQHLPGASEAWKGHVEKWGKILPRLVLIFHAIEQWQSFEFVVPSEPVGEVTVRRAIHFANCLLRHSLAFYDRYYGQSAAASEARKLAGYILTRPDKLSYRARDFGQAQKTLRDPQLLKATMRELEIAGWCRVEKHGAEGPYEWSVNPKAHERFAAHAEREIKTRARQRQDIARAAKARAALSKNAGGDE